jgi:cytosine/adenosine deaminase-related metal-dependent hydrolase
MNALRRSPVDRAWAPHEDDAGHGARRDDADARHRGGHAQLRRVPADRGRGTLEPGKSADFIVLDANPLDDITNTRRIAAVILRGAPVDRAQPVR